MYKINDLLIYENEHYRIINIIDNIYFLLKIEEDKIVLNVVNEGLINKFKRNNSIKQIDKFLLLIDINHFKIEYELFINELKGNINLSMIDKTMFDLSCLLEYKNNYSDDDIDESFLFDDVFSFNIFEK